MKAAVWEVRYSYLKDGKSYRFNGVTQVYCESIERAIEITKEKGDVLKDLEINQIIKRTHQEVLIDPKLIQ